MFKQSDTSRSKVVAIFIAYNAAETLENFYRQLPLEVIDECILVDDASLDDTAIISERLGITTFKNEVNLGYGGNLRRAIKIALERGAHIIIDIHPDGEYRPTVIKPAIALVEGGADLVLGKRFRYGYPTKRGMRLYKIGPILVLNWLAQVVLRTSISDPHQGFRVHTKKSLESLNIDHYTDNYLFSFELLAQSILIGAKISEVPVETSYQGKKRGASLLASTSYSIGVFKVLLQFILSKWGIKTRLVNQSQPT